MTEIRVALLGCGTVGTGVVKLLLQHEGDIRARLGAPVTLRHVVVRDPAAQRDAAVPTALLREDARLAIDDPDVDVIVELIGGTDVAREHVLAAIGAGKHVVTANKALLAAHGDEVFAAAEAAGVDVAFEAAVAGGIPIIRSLREALASDRVERLYGIINGTSNFLLTEMAGKGRGYDDVLAEAQRLGYAEADPTMDVEGLDAAQKLSILVALAFGADVPWATIPTEGLSRLEPQDFEYAHRFGYAIKPLAIAKEEGDGLEARVHPALVPEGHLLAAVEGVFNAVALQTTAVGPLLFHGRGAGMMPTAVSVVSDIIEVGRALLQGTSGRVPHLAWRHPGRALRRKPFDDVVCENYLRFTVLDRPGVLAALAGALGEQGVSIRQLIQPDAQEGRPVAVVVLTHAAREGDVTGALRAIDAQSTTAAPTLRLRIEDPA